MAEPTIAGIPTKDFDEWQAERVASGRAHVNDGGTMAGAEFATPADVAAKADASALTAHTSDTANPHSVTAAQVGLGNVANTAPADLPISTATQAALDGKQPLDADLTTLATLGVVSDPATGRLAIGGREIGDTGWRRILSWTGGVQDGSNQAGTIDTAQYSLRRRRLDRRAPRRRMGRDQKPVDRGPRDHKDQRGTAPAVHVRVMAQCVHALRVRRDVPVRQPGHQYPPVRQRRLGERHDRRVLYGISEPADPIPRRHLSRPQPLLAFALAWHSRRLTTTP